MLLFGSGFDAEKSGALASESSELTSLLKSATAPVAVSVTSPGPVDPRRVFGRTVKRHPEALRLLISADVVVATDLSATKTAWLPVHRGRVGEGIDDHRSASVGIRRQLPSAYVLLTTAFSR